MKERSIKDNFSNGKMFFSVLIYALTACTASKFGSNNQALSGESSSFSSSSDGGGGIIGGSSSSSSSTPAILLEVSSPPDNQIDTGAPVLTNTVVTVEGTCTYLGAASIIHVNFDNTSVMIAGTGLDANGNTACSQAGQFSFNAQFLHPGMRTLTLSQSDSGQVIEWHLNFQPKYASSVLSPQFGSRVADAAMTAGGSCGFSDIDGSLYCWGENANDRLGIGDTSNTYTDYLLIPTTGQGVKTSYLGTATYDQVVTTSNFNCALSTDNRALCWGDNSSGEIGYSNTCSATTSAKAASGAMWSTPMPVCMYGTDGYELKFKQISAMRATACAVTTLGQVYCWGANDYGQIGNGTQTTAYAPTPVSGLFNIAQVSVANVFTCALSAVPVTSAIDGLQHTPIYCWGYNANGQLGDTTTTNRLSPYASATNQVLVEVSRANLNAGEEFTEVSAGTSNACAATNLNNVYCWGYGTYGGIGNGKATANNSIPTLVTPVDVGVKFQNVYAGGQGGYTTNCATTTVSADGSSNSIYCWGVNDFGQLGNNATSVVSAPILKATKVQGTESNIIFKQTYSGRYDTCARTDMGKTYCWGYHMYGAVGDINSSKAADGSNAQKTPALVTYPAQ